MQEISVLHTQSLVIADGTETSAAWSLDSKILPILIGKLQMAQGNETLPEVKLWRSALISWGEHFEEDPRSFPFEKLKICVAQGLSRFTEEESTEDQGYAKRPRLNPTLPPAVAFSVEELNNYCAHAYAAGVQSHNPDI
eukprot:2943791-Rhodomonas_salina.1